MNSKQAMEIGMRIAEGHMANVILFIEDFEQSPKNALRGNLVALAADIMVELQRADVGDRTKQTKETAVA